MLRLARPSEMQLAQTITDERDRSFTYDEIGATASTVLPSGYHHVRCARVLGQGTGGYEKAVAALKDWGPQRGSGITVAADGPIAANTTVALAAPLPVGFAIAVCRVIYVEDEPDHFAFAYGSLPLHPERGEERFEVARSGETVTFTIVAFFRLQHPLARIGTPIARALQSKATRRYLDAMQRAIG